MDEHEAAARKAERKAAALYNVGWQTGAGATIWARAVKDVLALHESARERLAATADLEIWERLHATALMLVVAVDQVLAFEYRVRRLTGDARTPRRLGRAFDAAFPDATLLRDLVAHLDDSTPSERESVSWESASRRSVSNTLVPLDVHLLA